MATSVVPDLIDALVVLARANIDGVNVFDGYGNTEDPGDFLMVGVEDPDSKDFATSASVRQDWANAGTAGYRDEEGEITCAALSWNGDANQKRARDGAYGVVAALEDALRDNPALGLSSLLWTSFGTSSTLTQQQGEGGAVALIVFSIFFRARI